ncbi:uncharacterized protein LOC144866536 [Branchiostoma floridae x Branchiostoma japonicum]
MEDPNAGVRKHFFPIKEEVASNWRDLALQLGVKRSDIDNIASRNRDDKSRCMDLLEEWLKSKGKEATIEILIEALSKANLQSIVDKLRMKLPAGILEIHSKYGFKVVELKPRTGRKTIKGSSIPLILPNDLKYNASTGRVEKVQGAWRESLQVVDEAMELLGEIDGPVSVISICGPCRTGKSYFLSRLLGTEDAFELGHSMAPQTFGIWMGTKVLRREDFTIVLLDTEGIDAVGASAGQDASILVLTILLSSRLIYNSLNVPYKADLEKMQCFIQLAKRITVKKGERTQMSAFRDFFPDFLWLLRDVLLKMEDDNGKEMDPTEYLKTKVLEPQGPNLSISDEVGHAIRYSFPRVECAKLVRPSGETKVMNNIAQHTDSLNPEFNKGVHELTDMLLQTSSIKKSYDKASNVTGLALSIMINEYVDAVNDPNSIPAMDNTWKTTVEALQNRAVEEAIRDYNQQMQRKFATATAIEQDPLEKSEENVTQGHRRHSARSPLSESSLLELHNEVLKDVRDTLLEKVGHFGISSVDQSSVNNNLVERVQNRLDKREERTVDYVAADGAIRKQERLVVTGGELLQYIQQNEELSMIFCKDLCESLVGPIRQQLETDHPDYDFSTLTGEIKDALTQYRKEARGPGKWVVLQEMTKSMEKLEAEIEKIERYRSKERQAKEAQQREHEAELRVEKKETENQQLRKQAEDMQKTHQETLEKMERQHREQIEELKQDLEVQHNKELQTTQHRQNAETEKQAKKTKESYERESGELKEKIKNMKQELDNLKPQIQELGQQNKQMREQVIQDMQQAHTGILEAMERLKGKLEEQQMIQNAEREKREREDKEQLRNALSEKEKTIRRKEQKIQEMEQELAEVRRQLEEMKAPAREKKCTIS